MEEQQIVAMREFLVVNINNLQGNDAGIIHKCTEQMLQVA
jgi:hypothetical protein